MCMGNGAACESLYKRYKELLQQYPVNGAARKAQMSFTVALPSKKIATKLLSINISRTFRQGCQSLSKHNLKKSNWIT